MRSDLLDNVQLVNAINIYPFDCGLVLKREAVFQFFCFFFLKLVFVVAYDGNFDFLVFFFADVNYSAWWETSLLRPFGNEAFDCDAPEVVFAGTLWRIKLLML
jgi:hypothetical protein